MKHILLTLFLALQLFGVAITHIDTVVANGKTASIVLAEKPDVEYEYLEFGKKRFPILKRGDAKGYFALIPVAYTTQPHIQELYLHYKKHNEPKKVMVALEIIKGNYSSEEIEVDGSKVNPKSKEVQERIAKEYSEAMRVYGHITPKLYIDKPFVLPLQSVITSDFGKERLYNGRHKGFHSGTDFRAPVGTPVKASNDGVVVLVKNRFYSGGTVVIDHGEGIYTCYFHLSKFLVKKGERVKRSQLIALSGKSGRVTGPHLHFAVRVYGVQVDPMQFVTLMNNTILKDR